MKELTTISTFFTHVDDFLTINETNRLKITSKTITAVYKKIKDLPIHETREEDKQNNYAIARNKKRIKGNPPSITRKNDNSLSPTGAEEIDDMEKDFFEFNKALKDRENGILPYIYIQPTPAIIPTYSSTFQNMHTQEESNQVQPTPTIIPTYSSAFQNMHTQEESNQVQPTPTIIPTYSSTFQNMHTQEESNQEEPRPNSLYLIF